MPYSDNANSIFNDKTNTNFHVYILDILLLITR
jgi:hypothetical protein